METVHSLSLQAPLGCLMANFTSPCPREGRLSLVTSATKFGEVQYETFLVTDSSGANGRGLPMFKLQLFTPELLSLLALPKVSNVHLKEILSLTYLFSARIYVPVSCQSSYIPDITKAATHSQSSPTSQIVPAEPSLSLPAADGFGPWTANTTACSFRTWQTLQPFNPLSPPQCQQ